MKPEDWYSIWKWQKSKATDSESPLLATQSFDAAASVATVSVATASGAVPVPQMKFVVSVFCGEFVVLICFQSCCQCGFGGELKHWSDCSLEASNNSNTCQLQFYFVENRETQL